MATESTYSLDERQSGRFTATLLDEDDVAVQLAAISTITLTLYDKDTGDIINSRNAQNVKNLNQCTYHATSGLLTWLWLPADQVIVDDDKSVEQHVAMFIITWVDSSANPRQTDYRVFFNVKNLDKET